MSHSGARQEGAKRGVPVEAQGPGAPVCRGTMGAGVPFVPAIHPTPAAPLTHLLRSVLALSSGAALSCREQRPRPQERAVPGSTAGRLPIVPPLSRQCRERALPPAAVGKW